MCKSNSPTHTFINEYLVMYLIWWRNINCKKNTSPNVIHLQPRMPCARFCLVKLPWWLWKRKLLKFFNIFTIHLRHVFNHLHVADKINFCSKLTSKNLSPPCFLKLLKTTPLVDNPDFLSKKFTKHFA